jgi:hypothetical protein
MSTTSDHGQNTWVIKNADKVLKRGKKISTCFLLKDNCWNLDFYPRGRNNNQEPTFVLGYHGHSDIQVRVRIEPQLVHKSFVTENITFRRNDALVFSPRDLNLAECANEKNQIVFKTSFF